MTHTSDFSLKNWFLKEAKNVIFTRKYKDVFSTPDDEICFCTYEYEDSEVKILLSASSESFVDVKQVIDRQQMTLQTMFKFANPKNSRAFLVIIDWGDGTDVEFYLNKGDWCEIHECK